MEMHLEIKETPKNVTHGKDAIVTWRKQKSFSQALIYFKYYILLTTRITQNTPSTDFVYHKGKK